jgi:hypothetical protein
MKKNILSILVFLTSVVGVGCGQKLMPPSIKMVETQPIQFIDFEFGNKLKPSLYVSNENDIKQLINFAQFLYLEKKFSESKTYYLKAHGIAHSKGGELEEAIYAAATLCSLRMGDIPSFKAMTLDFENRFLSATEKLSPPVQFSDMVALGRYTRQENDTPIGVSNKILNIFEER